MDTAQDVRTGKVSGPGCTIEKNTMDSCAKSSTIARGGGWPVAAPPPLSGLAFPARFKR